MEKIIIITSNLNEIGGTERVAAILANGFNDILQRQVEILNLGKKKGELKYKLNDNIKIKYIGIDNGNDTNKINIIKNLIKIMCKLNQYSRNNLIKSDNITVIGIGTGISYLLPIIFRGYNYKLIGTQHNPIRHSMCSDFIRKIIIRCLNNYVVLDDEMKRDIECKVNSKNIEVIPNPLTIETNQYSNLEEKNVLAIGRLTYQKGFDRLIECWGKVSRLNPQWKLTIVGEGEDYDKLIAHINEKKLNNSISIEPFTTNIEEYYKKASIYALTSRYEGFGLVILEAQAYGIPVIAFDCPTGPRNIINDKVDGVLVEDGDIEKFSQSINNLINDIELRKNISKEAIINSQKFSIENIMDKWEKLILK